MFHKDRTWQIPWIRCRSGLYRDLRPEPEPWWRTPCRGTPWGWPRHPWRWKRPWISGLWPRSPGEDPWPGIPKDSGFAWAPGCGRPLRFWERVLKRRNSWRWWWRTIGSFEKISSFQWPDTFTGKMERGRVVDHGRENLGLVQDQGKSFWTWWLISSTSVIKKSKQNHKNKTTKV